MSSKNYEGVFVAFFDILGFSDLVMKNNHYTLKHIYDNLLELMLEESFKPLLDRKIYKSNIDIVSISDSFVIWSSDQTVSGFHDILLASRNMLIYSMQLGIPLRGAISKGDLSATKRERKFSKLTQTNVFGNGIVRAYGLEKNQQWSGCIIDKTCTYLIDSKAGIINNKYSSFSSFWKFESKKNDPDLYTIENLMKYNWIIKYDVPLHNNKVSNEYVVNWVKGNEQHFNEDTIYKAFSQHNKEITEELKENKIKNTIDFCEYVSGSGTSANTAFTRQA